MTVVEGATLRPHSPWEVAPIDVHEDHTSPAVPAPEARTARVADARATGKATPIGTEPDLGDASFVALSTWAPRGSSASAQTLGERRDQLLEPGLVDGVQHVMPVPLAIWKVGDNQALAFKHSQTLEHRVDVGAERGGQLVTGARPPTDQ